MARGEFTPKDERVELMRSLRAAFNKAEAIYEVAPGQHMAEHGGGYRTGKHNIHKPLDDDGTVRHDVWLEKETIYGKRDHRILRLCCDKIEGQDLVLGDGEVLKNVLIVTTVIYSFDDIGYSSHSIAHGRRYEQGVIIHGGEVKFTFTEGHIDPEVLRDGRSALLSLARTGEPDAMTQDDLAKVDSILGQLSELIGQPPQLPGRMGRAIVGLVPEQSE